MQLDEHVRLFREDFLPGLQQAVAYFDWYDDADTQAFLYVAARHYGANPPRNPEARAEWDAFAPCV